MVSPSIWRPYTQEKTAPASITLSHASGAYLYTKGGQKIFDGISSWWLITHGHCHPVISDAIARQASKLDQVTFANFTHEPAEELAERLIRITPASLSKLFFSDNGSTAVEVALKMALQACAQMDKPEKTMFLAFESSYHGDTVGAMSVSGASAFNNPYKKTLFTVLRAKHPKLSTAPVAEWVGDFINKIEAHHKDLAGVIVEPLLQGAGGMIVWPEEAVRLIVAKCKKLGVFVIFDEVMTGFGRTGEMFAMDRLKVVPDFLCLSKGLTGGSLPLAVTLTTAEIFDAFQSTNRSKMFFHGHSFTGNPISCAAAVANLNVFHEEKTLNRIRASASIQKSCLEKLAAKFSLGDPRVCGTVAAFEVDHSDYLALNQKFTIKAIERGLFLRTLGGTVYVMPPYCSTRSDLEWVWQEITTILHAQKGAEVL